MDQDAKVDQDAEQKYYPSKSDAIVFQYCDDPLAFEMWTGFKGLEDSAKKLGFPLYNNRKYISAFFKGDDSPRAVSPLPSRFNKYTIEIFGIQVKSQPIHPKAHNLPKTGSEIPEYGRDPVYWRESAQHWVHIWRTRVFDLQLSSLNICPAMPLSGLDPWNVYFEERWHPNGGLRWSVNWNENRKVNTFKLSQFTQDALRIVGHTEKKQKEWSSRRFDNREKFKREMLNIYRTESNRIESHPSQEVIAAGMGISRTTLYRRLKEFKMPWPPE